MNQQTVKCPKCGNEFELTKALTEKIDRDLRAEIEGEFAAKLAAERDRFTAERDKLVADAKSKVAEALGIELKAAQEELQDKREQLAAAKKAELELMKEKRELKERNEALDLEVFKKVEEERGKIAKQAEAKAVEQQQLKLREKDNLIKSLNDRIGDLQRRIEVGSQEGQGEALEGELIDVLRARFPFDDCEEIKKGQRGADILQRVRSSTGRDCGTILWESKNTKAFAGDWIDKLKKDQQEAGADLAVLMTMAMPAGIDDFDLHQEVWVTSFGSALSLCGVLRQMLIGIDRERLVSSHREGTKDVIYRYITGNEFAQRVKLIAAAYQQMRVDLQSEKNSMNRIWKKREKQIASVLDSVSGMYGEIEGLLVGEGASLPRIEALSLEAIAEEEGE